MQSELGCKIKRGFHVTWPSSETFLEDALTYTNVKTRLLAYFLNGAYASIAFLRMASRSNGYSFENETTFRKYLDSGPARGQL